MKRIAKKMLIILSIGFGLIILGGIIFTIAMASNGWDFSSLNTTKYEYSFYQSNQPITELQIDFNTADIIYEETEQDSITVEYPLAKNKNDKFISSVTTTEQDGKLIIKEKLKWTAYINPFSFNDKSPTVTVKVPTGSNFDAILKTDNGHITIGESNKNYSFKSLTAQTDNGAIYARPILSVENEVKFKTDNGEIVLNGNLNCSTLTVNTDNGKIEINGNINATNASLSNDNGLISIISDLTLSGKLTISNDNGQISMYNNVVANEIYIENDTGGINCENGCFLAKKITAKNDVGTISLTLKGKKEDYSCTLKTDVGKTNISSYTSGANIVTVSTDVGDINVFFTDTVKL